VARARKATTSCLHRGYGTPKRTRMKGTVIHLEGCGLDKWYTFKEDETSSSYYWVAWPFSYIGAATELLPLKLGDRVSFVRDGSTNRAASVRHEDGSLMRCGGEEIKH